MLGDSGRPRMALLLLVALKEADEVKDFRRTHSPELPPALAEGERSAPLLTVVFVTYGSRDDALRSLASVYRYNDIGDSLEVVLVDNTPGAPVMDAVQRQFPKVRCFANDNRGFGEGNNRGVEAARGHYLLLLNPDAVLVEPVFSWAATQFAREKNLGVFGPRLVDGHGKEAIPGGWIVPGGALKLALKSILGLGRVFVPGKMVTSGAALFVRRKAFLSVGGFDDDTFLYGEERYLGRNLARAGWSWKYAPAVTIAHHGNASGTSFDVAQAHEVRSLVRFCETNGINVKRTLEKQLRATRVAQIAKRLLGRPPNDAREKALCDALSQL